MNSTSSGATGITTTTTAAAQLRTCCSCLHHDDCAESILLCCACSNFTNDVFASRTVARWGATSSLDCLSEFYQLVDGAWFLPLQSDAATRVTQNVQLFADCVALCPAGSDCQFVMYDYMAKTCTVRFRDTIVYEG